TRADESGRSMASPERSTPSLSPSLPTASATGASMPSTFSVYCSGSIAKGASDIKKLCWTDTERDNVASGAQPHNVVFLNPDDPIVDAANTLGQFGRDMYQVMSASAVIVDARERRGIGIGVEMAAA